MDKYLLEILKEMNTIIIPGLGALTITNTATGEIMFMPYLKYDDGKLARYIAKKEGWPENDAQNLIAKYVRKIEAKLNTGDTYDMYRFGSFSKNASGDIEFHRWKETEVLAEETNYVEPHLGNEVVEEPLTESSAPSEPESTSEEITIAEPAKSEQLNEISEVPEPEEEVIVVEEAQVTEYVPETIVPETKFQLYSEEDQWNDDLDLPPINAKVERPKKPILEKTQKDKKRRPVITIALIAGVLLIGGTLTVVLFYNSFRKVDQEKIAKNQTEKHANEQKVTEPAATQKEEPTQIVDEVVQEQPETPVAESASTTGSGMIQTSTGQVDPARPYHLIAGAFTVKENAERFRDRLRESGNSNAEIIGQFDGLYVVSAGSYSNYDEALAAGKENSTISKSWIFHWP